MRITKRHLNLVQEEELAAEKLQPTYSVFGGSYENKQHRMLSVQSINTEYKLLSSVSHLSLIVHLTYIMCSQTHQLHAKMIEFVSSFPPPSYQGKQPKKKFKKIRYKLLERKEVYNLFHWPRHCTKTCTTTLLR